MSKLEMRIGDNESVADRKNPGQWFYKVSILMLYLNETTNTVRI